MSRLLLLASLMLFPITSHGNPFIRWVDFGFNDTLGLTSIQDCNERGECIAASIDASRSILVSRAQDVRTLIACPEASFTTAKSLNLWRTVVGFCEVDGLLSGFVRERDGDFTLLQVPGALLTQALGVSDLGIVVGNYRDTLGAFHGFRWRHGVFTTVDAPFPDTQDTSLTSINTLGHVIGFSRTSAGVAQAFLRRQGTFVPLEVPGALETLPLDVNLLDEVVGVYVDTAGTIKGFFWDGSDYYGVAVPGAEVVLTDLASLTTTGVMAGRVVVHGANPGEFVSRGFIVEGLPLEKIAPVPVTEMAARRAVPSERAAHWCEQGHGIAKLRGVMAACPK